MTSVDAPGGRRAMRLGRMRSVLRMVVALLAACLVALAIWELSPRGLRPPINIVGYPTFADFHFHPGFLHYRLIVWVIPAVSVAALAVLWRWGPLAGSRAQLRPEPTSDEAPTCGDTDGADPAPSSARLALVLPAAGAITIAVSSRGAEVGAAVTGWGFLAGLGYTLAVLLVGTAFARRSGGLSREAWQEWVTRVNGPVAAVAAVVAVCVFARSTATLVSSGEVHSWAWVPWWAAACFVVAAAVWAALSLLAGVAAAVVERRAAGILGGSALVFMMTSGLPGPIGQLQGFDDMQSVTGADLFSRGYFPWRDVTFIHGAFEDGLRSWAGFALFEHTLWGTGAAGSALWIPLGWVAMFLFALWALRGRWLPLLCVTALTIWASTVSSMPFRWWFAPIVWILLGEALRRGRTRWTVLLVTALFVEAVLVPEASFQVIGVLLVLVLHDLTTRPAGTSWWRCLRKTRDGAITGIALLALWAGFLSWHDSLKEFVDWYLIFGPGHVESGALPFGVYATTDYKAAFFTSAALVTVTLVVAGWVLVARRPISTRQWVMLGCAVTAGLYGEKALGRMDDGHLVQSITVAIPLAILWIAVLLPRADVSLDWLWRKRGQQPRGRPRVAFVSVVALATILVALPAVRDETWRAPSSNKANVLVETLPRLGYSVPETYEEALLADLGSAVDGYNGREGGFFDFTNGLGWFYYLLRLDPTTSYFHVSMAIPEFSQEDLVRQLEEDPPAVVAFDGPIGLPAWDGVANEIRHFDVSQYLLDGWTPVLSTHGVIFMLRNDLLADAPPTPQLLQEPRTADLYFAAPACDWGYVPNYLESPATGRSVSVDVDPARRARRIDVAGWAIDHVTDRLPTRILLVAGRQILATTSAGIDRPDVAAALESSAAAKSGFAVRMVTPEPGTIRVYAEYADGLAYPLTDRGVLIESLLLPDGAGTVKVARSRGAGSVDETKVLAGRLTTVDLPPDLPLKEVQTLSISNEGGALGRGDYVLTDNLVATGAGDRTIRFQTLFRGGERVPVRVGSCLQWHGFVGDQLYLFRRRGHDVQQVTFSGLPET